MPEKFGRKKIIIILLACMMVLIFCFSAQPADDSTETSSRFCIIAAKILYPDYDAYDRITQEIIADGLTFLVRKAAHFTEYALMGFLWYLFFSDRKQRLLFSVGASALYASSDELHQLFVPGRSGQISDVLLDTCGSFCGSVIALIILCVAYCWKSKISVFALRK